MENLELTTQHLARIKQRQEELRTLVADIVPVTGSLIWEIGSGHGHFLTALAATQPDVLHIGVDIIRERIERANRKRDRAKLANLHFILADAQDFLDALAPAVTFDAIYILFPDPWPKRRHHKNRLIQSTFLQAVARRVGEGARLYFRTDYEAYFAETLATFSHHLDWVLVEEPWPFELVTVFQSRAQTYKSLIVARRSAALV